ncbi:MAG: polysaccharide deacetylase family protein [Hyphomicrobiaceae bacterium]|nr:polysaccharide deacetylase family protein [Hyphomicrobiaceae bacterium]
MSRRNTQLLKAALATLHFTGTDNLVAPLVDNEGVVFMLHRVTPEPAAPFEPNRILKVTPDFIEAVIRHVVSAGFEILTLDEIPERLRDDRRRRPFACFTFDDGYRDNLVHALPVFKRLGVPFAVYVPTDYPDGRGDLWWLMLERVVAASTSITVDLDGARRHFDVSTTAAKCRAFDAIYWPLRAMPEERARETVRRLAESCGFDGAALCRELVMTWDEIRTLAAEPLVTIGAHTVRHMALSKLDEATARREMAESMARIEAELGRACRHFSYPYGCEQSAGPREFALAEDVGAATAVTTRKGLVRRGAASAVTALPRLSLNGDFQDIRYVKTMLTGVPFALWDAASRLKRHVPAGKNLQAHAD